MMVGVARATHEDREPILCHNLTLGRIRRHPIFGSLPANRRHHHGNGAVEFLQDLLFRLALGLVEFAVTVPAVCGLWHPPGAVVCRSVGYAAPATGCAVALRMTL